MAKNRKKKLGSFEVPELGNACQTLLANIRFASVDEEIRTIVVTSPVPDEGKTTVSSNLALAIASSGKRVLLVDADMRRRCIGGLLGVHPAHGIHALLSGRATISEAVVPTSYSNLFFLDCEPNIPNPPDILANKRFADMARALAASFDYVIFDAPPVGVFVDAAIVGSVVDGALLVVRERRTRRDEVANAVQQLRTANARILGAVMTFSQAEDSNYYYSYYNERDKRSGKGKPEKEASLPSGHGATGRTAKASAYPPAREPQSAQQGNPAVRPVRAATHASSANPRANARNRAAQNAHRDSGDLPSAYS